MLNSLCLYLSFHQKYEYTIKTKNKCLLSGSTEPDVLSCYHKEVFIPEYPQSGIKLLLCDPNLWLLLYLLKHCITLQLSSPLPPWLQQPFQLLGQQLSMHALRAAHTSGQDVDINDTRLGICGWLLQSFTVESGWGEAGQNRIIGLVYLFDPLP